MAPGGCVLGVLVALAASPLIGGIAGWAMDRGVSGPMKAGQWVTSAAGRTER